MKMIAKPELHHPPALDAGRFSALAEQSDTLPSDWYFDPAVFRQEHEAIFYRSWCFLGHVSDIPKPGDYFTGQVMDQEIVIIRGEDRQIRGFYNVCSHRAHPLLAGQGNTRLIVCPYHQWCYQSDGKFRGARGRDALKEWIPDNADLKAVRIEEYGGLLFANLDREARPLIDQAGKLLAAMRDACPRMDSLVRAATWERDVAANWKTVIDNNHECYHCAVNHKALMELIDYDTKAAWSDDGITFIHAVEKKNLENSAYALRTAELEQEALFGFVFPTTIPLMFPGTASLAVFQVIPTGPETTRERWHFYFANSTPSEAEQKQMDYIRNTLVPEDVGLCEAVQKGLHSRGYRQGRFVVDRDHCEYSEHHVHFFQKLVHDAMMAPR